MTVRTPSILVCLIALITACSTTSTTSSEPTTSPLEPAADHIYTVVAFGDSTTAPRDVNGESLRVYADIIRDALEAEGGDVKVVNSGILERLKTVAEKDSSLSAVVTLHMFAEVVLFNIEESLEEVRYLFLPYLENL